MHETTEPFDGYPYLVTRIGRSALRHIAVLPADWPRGRLLELARRQAEANRLETCLCLGPTDAVSFTPDGETGPAVIAPTRIGYLVGDGLEGGRPAAPADIDRLSGLGADGVPKGLTRCMDCRRFAGDYLALDGEGDGDRTPRVIRFHCRCENHNRCAGCGKTLADRRLSAYCYEEADRTVAYAAAYNAIGHPCPR